MAALLQQLWEASNLQQIPELRSLRLLQVQEGEEEEEESIIDLLG
jgi:hypothetical protein